MLLAVFLARLPSLWEPRWSHDEGTLAAVAQQVLAGGRLYVDAWDDQQPLPYYWMAAVLALTRGWHPGMQLVLALQVLLATGCVYLLAARLGGRPAASALLFGLVAALPLVEGDLQNVELIGLPLFLLGVLLAIGGGTLRAAAGGALLAAAAFCQPGYALQALCVPWFVVLASRPLRLLPLAGGGLAATAVLWAGLWLGGSLAAFQALRASQEAYLVWANGGPELAPLALLLRLLPIGAALLAGLRIGWEQETPAARLLGAWLPLAVASAVLSPRGFMHYGLLALAPLSLLLGLWTDRRLFLPVAVGLVLALQTMLYLPRLEMFLVGTWPLPRYEYADFGWSRLPGYYRAWYDRATGVTGWRAYEARFPGDPLAVEDLAAAMKVRGSLYVWGDEPWLYVVSGRPASGRYLNLNSAWRLRPDGQKEALAAVERHPEYVVVAEPTNRDLDRRLAADYDRLRFLPGPWRVYGLHSG